MRQHGRCKIQKVSYTVIPRLVCMVPPKTSIKETGGGGGGVKGAIPNNKQGGAKRTPKM